MLSNDVLIKRLSLIKQLYQIGLEQSYKNEAVSAFSVLSFHDSIEMFLKLLTEHLEIDATKFKFMQYWEHIPNLNHKESMRNLNNRRVNIKHKGLLPAKSEVEVSRVNTTDFFEQNTKAQFGIEFKDISLISLIVFSTVKEFLIKAEEALKINDTDVCIENTAYAFDELLFVYSSNKSSWMTSPFFFGKSLTFYSGQSLGLTDEFGGIGKFADDLKESVEQLQKAMKVISFGIDYREYIKFRILTPTITRTISGDRFAEIYGKKKWTSENCQYCIDFVIKSSLKLQEFDFDIEHLEDEKAEDWIINESSTDEGK